MPERKQPRRFRVESGAWGARIRRENGSVDTTIEGAATMFGPFWMPLRSDWAFWVFCLALVADLGVRVLRSWDPAQGEPATFLFMVGLSVLFDVLALVSVFAVIIGMPRGFLMGLRGGRRVHVHKPSRTGVD